MTPSEERLGWLEALIGDYERLRHAQDMLAVATDEFTDAELRMAAADEDPTATQAMLHECKLLLADLREQQPAQAGDHQRGQRPHGTDPLQGA